MAVPQVSMKQLLFNMGRYDASDLHIKVGMPPVFRIGGELRALGLPPLSEQDTDRLMGEIIPPGLRERFDKAGDLDFSTFLDTKAMMAREAALRAPGSPAPQGGAPGAEGGAAAGAGVAGELEHHYHEGVDRFRCNIYRAGGGMHGAIRRIKPSIPTFESLHLPKIYETIADTAMEGLVLVVGVTGSGKSSTLACMIERINQTRACNIITIEDPVEYHFHPRKSIISQREIGLDVPTYRDALKFVVRQDPDIIFIGELRDHDTVLAAIQAAETGHLVFGSLHTADAMQAFSRIIEFFPQNEHEFLRSSLSNSLKAICAQRLIPANTDATRGAKAVPATEVLLNNATVKERIREGHDEDIPAIINGSLADGMRSFTHSLAELVETEMISLDNAMENAPNREALSSRLKGVQVRAATLVHRTK